MSNSPILNIGYIAEAQDNKEATANAQVDALEQALNSSLSFVASPGTIAVSLAQFTRYFAFYATGSMTGSPNQLTLSVPNISRYFAVANATTAGQITVSNGDPLTVTLNPGEAKTLVSFPGLGILTVGGGTASGGDYIGPASSTDNAIHRFDGATGKRGQNSGVLIDDSDNLSGNGSVVLRITGNLTLDNTHCGKTILSDSNAAHTITVPVLTTLKSGFYCSIVRHGATAPLVAVSGSDVLDSESKPYVRRAANLLTIFQSQAGSPSGGIVGLYGDLSA